MKVVYDKNGKKGETFTITDSHSLEKGRYIFGGSNIKEFNSSLDSLVECEMMFYNCTSLTKFSADLSNLKDASRSFSPLGMFYGCTSLTSFTSNLGKLESGWGMFDGCTSLTSFCSDSKGSPVNLENLSYGYSMFARCTSLESFTSNLPKLEYGFNMFDGCTSLNTFTTDLPSLIDGSNMFKGCDNLKYIRNSQNGDAIIMSKA